MFGSDWPVSTMTSDYGRTVQTSLDLCKGLSDQEKRKVFFENARDFYRINI